MYRYPVHEGHNWAVIKFGRHETNVLLIDESAGGFSVASGPIPGIEQGTQFTLQTAHAGCYLVEVVHLQELGEEVRLGLRRLRELRSTGASPLSKEDAKLQPRNRWMRMPSRAAVVNFSIAGVCLLALWIAIPSSWSNRANSDSAPKQLVEREHGQGAKKAAPTAMSGVALANSITSPKVMRKLHLTETQQESINHTFEETAIALNSLYKYPGIRSEQQVAQEATHIVERSLQRFLCMLTDKQLRQWMGMLATESSAPDDNDQVAR